MIDDDDDLQDVAEITPANDRLAHFLRWLGLFSAVCLVVWAVQDAMTS